MDRRSVVARLKTLMICCLFIVIPVSCGSNNISRNKAESLIYHSQKIKKLMSEVPLHKNGYEKGKEQEMWIFTGILWNKKIETTGKGEKYFSNVDKYKLLVVDPVDIDINVTGITDSILGEGVKEAQFQWKYFNIPSVVKRFIIIGGIGRAYFRKYDDGWRLEDIEIKKTSEPAIMSDKEREDEQSELFQINERKRIRAEKKRNEKERLNRLTKKSQTETSVLGEFTLHWKSYLGGSHTGMVTFTASVTDVNINTVSVDKSRSGTGSVTSERTYWFGRSKDFRKVYDNKSGSYGIEFDYLHDVKKNRWIQKKWWDSKEKNIDNALKMIKRAKKQWIEIHQEIAGRYNSIDRK